MRTFMINRKKYPQFVAPITDAGVLSMRGDCTLFPYQRRRMYGSLGVFIRTPDGGVYHAMRGVNIIDDYGCNDLVRRAWCQAAGVPWKDFRAGFRAARDASKQEECSARLHSLRNKAGALGYKLVKSSSL